MVWVDYVIIAIVLLSALISVVRGFVREAFSLAGWIGAFWVAFTFSERLAMWFGNYISVSSMRLLVAFFILLILTLFVVALINFLISQLVEKTGLTGTDRVLGVLFGVARGVAVVTLLVLLAGFTPVTSDPWWKESLLLPHFEVLALWLREYLPPELADDLAYG
jgi:membrane protein required for colicin V production